MELGLFLALHVIPFAEPYSVVALVEDLYLEVAYRLQVLPSYLLLSQGHQVLEVDPSFGLAFPLASMHLFPWAQLFPLVVEAWASFEEYLQQLYDELG